MGTRHKKTRVAHATVAHRHTMDRMLDRHLAPKLRKLVERESAAVRRALLAALHNQRNLQARALHARMADAILLRRAPAFQKKIEALLLDHTRETQAEAVRSLANFMGAIKIEGSSLDDHSSAQKIMRRSRASLNASRREAAARLAADMRSTAHKALKEAPEMSVKKLIDYAAESLEGQWWKVERTIRTETSVAFNTTQNDAFDDLQEEFPGLYRRWTELVNDITGAPLDDRVGQDSLLLHGQVAKPGELFRMPNSPLTPSALVGGAWSAPPNRPNDRAVLTPWYSGCGVPAWAFVGGERRILK